MHLRMRNALSLAFRIAFFFARAHTLRFRGRGGRALAAATRTGTSTSCAASVGSLKGRLPCLFFAALGVGGLVGPPSLLRFRSATVTLIPLMDPRKGPTPFRGWRSSTLTRWGPRLSPVGPCTLLPFRPPCPCSAWLVASLRTSHVRSSSTSRRRLAPRRRGAHTSLHWTLRVYRQRRLPYLLLQ